MLSTERMSYIPIIVTILVISQASWGSSFIMNTNPPFLLHSTRLTNGYDADIIDNLLEIVNRTAVAV